MSLTRRVALSLTFAISWGFCAAPAAADVPRHPPVEDFAGWPELSQPSLSPDGKRLASIQTYQGRQVIVILTLDPPGQPPVVLPYKDGYIVGVNWANDNRILITVNLHNRWWANDPASWYRVFSVDAKGENGVMLLSDRTIHDPKDLTTPDLLIYNAATIVDPAPDDPDHIYMELRYYAKRGGYRDSVFRVDVNTGKSEPVVEGWSYTTGWVMDGHGHAVARIDTTKKPFKDHLLIHTANDD